MLKEVKFIQNIGRFETARPTHDATFDRCTIIFGENGWGKSNEDLDVTGRGGAFSMSARRSPWGGPPPRPRGVYVRQVE